MFSFRALAAEQGNPVPEQPIVFMKPTSSYVTEGQSIQVSSLHSALILHVLLSNASQDKILTACKRCKKDIKFRDFFYCTLYHQIYVNGNNNYTILCFIFKLIDKITSFSSEVSPK